MILGFLLTALYWPGLAGAATTPRWGLLAVVLPILLLRRPSETKFTFLHLIGVLFLAWSATSLIWTSNQLDGLGELIKLVILAQAFMLGSLTSSLRSMLLGMSIGLIPSTGILIIESWYPDFVLHTTTHAGLFVNSGSLGEIAALALIGLVYYRRWWLCVALLPCIILPQSRGAWLALVAAGIVWTWGRSKLSALVLIAIAVISFAYSLHLGFHVASVEQRLGMYQDAIAGLTWLGHGIGSFWTDYAPLSNTLDIFLERPEHLHNDWLEIVFEQGVIGGFIIAAIAISTLVRQGGGAAKFILAGFAAEALVGFPLHNPCTAFLAALCLGHLARDGISVRDLVNDCGVFLQVGIGRIGRWRDGQRSSPVGSFLSA